jgi:hypothetical protein
MNPETENWAARQAEREWAMAKTLTPRQLMMYMAFLTGSSFVFATMWSRTFGERDRFVIFRQSCFCQGRGCGIFVPACAFVRTALCLTEEEEGKSARTRRHHPHPETRPRASTCFILIFPLVAISLLSRRLRRLDQREEREEMIKKYGAAAVSSNFIQTDNNVRTSVFRQHTQQLR